MFSNWSLFFILSQKRNQVFSTSVITMFFQCIVHIILLTVKSLNTRFRDPRLKAMRAALGWLTIAFCALGVEEEPPAVGGLNRFTNKNNYTVFLAQVLFPSAKLMLGANGSNYFIPQEKVVHILTNKIIIYFVRCFVNITIILLY